MSGLDVVTSEILNESEHERLPLNDSPKKSL